MTDHMEASNTTETISRVSKRVGRYVMISTAPLPGGRPLFTSLTLEGDSSNSIVNEPPSVIAVTYELLAHASYPASLCE